MLKAKDRLIAGISGGADSVCLLFVLLEWAKRVPLELAVVHVNHGIRKEAAQDALYVEQLCKQHGIRYYLTEADVAQRAVLEKCSEEEAGRHTRYEAFEKAARDFGASKIAVAHNCNDRSETMLFHLFRGSGIKGLGSIQPVRGQIIRPILCLKRQEIEAYLQALGVSYCTDATNATDDYTRNRIRHHIIPYAEREIVQDCVSHMAQTAEQLSEIEDFLSKQTLEALKGCVEPIEGGNSIIVSQFLQNHIVIQKRILHKLLIELSPRQRDISNVHIHDLLGLFTKEGNRMVCLPFEIRGRREYGRVVIERKVVIQEKPAAITINLPGDTDMNSEYKAAFPLRVALWNGMELVFQLLGNEEFFPEVPQNRYTKWFDYDKIKECKFLMVRTRQVGDYLTIKGSGDAIKHKSLKDFMINQKIPHTEREQIPVLADGLQVIWLAGYRISENYKINENTKRILQVQLIGKELR
ncbi:MAG: tRNA lysidine(34) synthetase TilS [Lachnospiraceae bacterium]|nr:tRNA lysidine(34) synthetase TilS [Lachnospiraceae bacterium]